MTAAVTRRLLVAAVLMAAAAGCGGGGDSGDGIASLSGAAAADETDDSDGGGDLRAPNPEFQDALLEYAECMRDQGVDMPDPQFDEGGGGGVTIGGPDSKVDPEEFEAADEACHHIMEEVEQDLPQLTPEEQAEMRDRALAFAECMRDHGIDMPDPEFSDDGEVGIRLENRAGAGGDARPFDPEDEEFQDAAEACNDELGDGGVFGGRLDSEDEE